MENTIKNISENLIMLRKSNNLTQKEFAEKFGYSDKAISRWELGDSLPSVETLLKVCEFYGIEFEWLLTKHTEAPKSTTKVKNNIKIAITLLFIVCCFMLAVVIFVYGHLAYNIDLWQAFVWAVPLSAIAVTICSQKWWGKLTSTISLSVCVWSVLASIFVQLLPKTSSWPIFLLGVPIQLILILLFYIDKGKKL